MTTVNSEPRSPAPEAREEAGYVVERSEDFGQTWVKMLGPKKPGYDGKLVPVSKAEADTYEAGYRGGLSKRAPVLMRVRRV